MHCTCTHSRTSVVKRRIIIIVNRGRPVIRRMIYCRDMRGGLFPVFRRSTKYIINIIIKLLCIGRYASVRTNSTGRRTHGARDEYCNDNNIIIFLCVSTRKFSSWRTYRTFRSLHRIAGAATLTDYRALAPPAGRIRF